MSLPRIALAFLPGLLVLSVPGVGEPAPKSALPVVAADDWPWWRGPAGDGVSRDRRAATRWGPVENVAWKTAVPGRGHSSPVLWGGRVFLTTADEPTQKQSVLAFDRASGKLLWDTVASQGGFPHVHPKNSHASATPACDGERVYSAFVNHDALFVTATDLDGKVVWQQKAGTFRSQHGYGSAPILYGSLVIVNGDSLQDCFLAALDRASGKVVWRTERKTTGENGSYATPLVAGLAGKPQLILSGMGEVSSYDPLTGKRLWVCTGPAEVTASTAAVGEDLVFVTGGWPEKEVLAVRADGAGDVTNSHVVWRTDKGVSYVPSPLYHEGRLYLVSDNGTATCFEAATGRRLWQERLAGGFTSSPVLVGDLVYVTNEAGKTYLFKTGPKFERAGVNDLADGVLASPAVCGGQVFLRTSHFLYCIGKP